MQYKKVIVGGSFDYLHKGHVVLLSKAFSVGEKVLIGVNSDKFCRDRNKKTQQTEEERINNVNDFLTQNGLQEKAITHIHNEEGCPADIDGELEAIIVSEETKIGGEKVNEKRRKNNLGTLEILSVPQVLAEDGKPISSSRIRNGEIDREGNSYINLFSEDLALPESLRSELKNPFGELTKEFSESDFCITIGDVVTVEAIKRGVTPDLSIFDKKTKRHAAAEEIIRQLPNPDHKIKNKAGTIGSAAALAIEKAIKEALTGGKKAIEVEGEEDLLAVPSIVLSPLGGSVYYGIPDKGAVKVLVTEEKKKEIVELVRRFEKQN